MVRDQIHRNKVPCEFLYDAKPLIQMSQGHPKKQKTCWQFEICAGGGGGCGVYKKIIVFYLDGFGMDH